METNKATSSDKTWTARFKESLDSVDPLGSFATAGSFDPPALQPVITVDGVGVIGFPVNPVLAEALKAKAEKAPYGCGAETLQDEKVRSAWQIDATKVSIKGNTEWDETLHDVLLEACYALGFSSKSVNELGIELNLYKLLIYEVGGHFKPHRDTEKEDGMFGTLIVQLPSDYKGGALVVNHKGETKTFELSTNCMTEFQYAAFFADC